MQELRRLEYKAYGFIQSCEYEPAIQVYQTGNCKLTSRSHFNLGMLHHAVGSKVEALIEFKKSVAIDAWLSIAYFMCAIILHDMSDYEQAWDYYNKCHVSLRGNLLINYEQMGLDLCVTAEQVLIGMGICNIELGQMSNAQEYFKLTRVAIHQIQEYKDDHLNSEFFFVEFFKPKRPQQKAVRSMRRAMTICQQKSEPASAKPNLQFKLGRSMSVGAIKGSRTYSETRRNSTLFNVNS